MIISPGKNRKAHRHRGTAQRLSYITSCLFFTIKAFQSLGPAVCTGRKRPAHYVRFDGISSITWTESKLMNSSLCVKRSDASIQSNWGFFLCSVRLHHWGTKPSASHFSNKVRKLAISLPQRQRFQAPYLYTMTQRRENSRKDSFDHSHLHNVLYWSIRRRQRASAVLFFKP